MNKQFIDLHIILIIIKIYGVLEKILMIIEHIF
jgi:hypothetical protein